MIDVFWNRKRPNYEEVISYGPRWWLEWLEMDTNYRYAGWTLDLMAYWMERVVSNQFPMHADMQTIEKLEKLFNIDVDYSMTLEERRKIVASYYFFNGHLSKTAIRTIIQTCTECDSEIWWGGDDENILKIDIMQSKKDISAATERVFDIINRRKPAHIAMDMRICVRRIFVQPLHVHFGGAVETAFSKIPIMGEDRTSTRKIAVAYGGFAVSAGTGTPAPAVHVSADRGHSAGGVYCHTHTKSRLIE